MGQKNCIELLKKAVNKTLSAQDSSITSLILYGISQGGATAINYLAQERDNKEVMDKIKLLILESTLLSGNNVITKVGKAQFGIPSFPFSWIILPYVGAFKEFPTFSPSGPQASKEYIHVRQNLPIVIINARHDDPICVQEGAALYAGINGRQQCFLYRIIVESKQHTEILHPKDPETVALNKIIIRHIKEAYDPIIDKELAIYGPQPSALEIRAFHTIARTDRTIARIAEYRRYLPIGAVVTFFWFVNSFFNR